MEPNTPEAESEAAETREIVVFHDESGDFGHGEWVFTGMLWLARDDVEPLAKELRAQREEHAGEIHFYRFPRNFGGSYGAGARTARAWLQLWRAEWARRTWLSVLAVNRRHIRYDHVRFARPREAYNHFTALALRTGLAAFFKGHGPLRLAIWSDERSGRIEGEDDAPLREDGGFTEALRQAALEAQTAGDVALVGDPGAIPVRALSGADTAGTFSAEQELLQLTDLLLGSVSTAILPRTVAATKLWLAREMARLVEGARRPAATANTLELRGRLLVSYYPDPVGRVYQDGQLGIWDL
jgi:hypothetical protein